MKQLSEDHKQAIGDAQRGKPKSPEHRAAIAAAFARKKDQPVAHCERCGRPLSAHAEGGVGPVCSGKKRSNRKLSPNERRAQRYAARRPTLPGY